MPCVLSEAERIYGAFGIPFFTLECALVDGKKTCAFPRGWQHEARGQKARNKNAVCVRTGFAPDADPAPDAAPPDLGVPDAGFAPDAFVRDVLRRDAAAAGPGGAASALDETAGEAEVAAATARLTALQPQLTCDNLLQRTSSEAGLLGSDLGEADVANLAPQFQQVASAAEVGTVSSPVRTPLGLHLVAVCGRRVGGAEIPSYREVEGRLQNQNLAMLARRYIRDLRADALIEVK
jgi:hypothetical protein